MCKRILGKVRQGIYFFIFASCETLTKYIALIKGHVEVIQSQPNVFYSSAVLHDLESWSNKDKKYCSSTVHRYYTCFSEFNYIYVYVTYQ